MDLYASAAGLGLQTDFVDGNGHPHRIDRDALAAVLRALPELPSRAVLPAIPVLRTGEPPVTSLLGSVGGPVHWSVRQAGHLIASGEAADGTVSWPADLPAGVHRVWLKTDDGQAEQAPIVVAPALCHQGEFHSAWLIAIQLYGVRSHRNWGIGDFTDLQDLIRFAAGVGAAGVGINPLHALFDDRPHECSPYSPNSRQFWNVLYIDVSVLPGVSVSPDERAELQRLRSEALVDYAAVAKIKLRALRSAFAHAAGVFDPDFDAFRAERGETLTRFACFEVLRHCHKTPWWAWDDCRSPQELKMENVREEPERDEIEFIEYTQWIADRQLRACRDLAQQLGMSVGLYLDVAVGVQTDGFDAWDEQAAISRQLGVGAPPDSLNTAGQSWGLAGYNPAGLEAKNFAPFREMLRASMRYAGAIRLDHVLGLKRLYLVPHGYPPREGVYIQMPFEALLAVTALESVANQCIVIGEDLGTVPEGFRETVARWGLWSYRVVMFERDYHSKKFLKAEDYPANALVTFNTHDIATYAGWRSFADLEQKRKIGVDPGESDEDRWQALGALTDVLRESHIHGDSFDDVIAFMSRAPSRLLAVSLEDLLGVVEQPNIPGTVNENPNWRRRLPTPIEDYPHAIDLAALRRATAARARSRQD